MKSIEKHQKIEQVPRGAPRPCPSQISVGKSQRLPLKKIRSTGIAFGESRFRGQVPGVGLILYSLACQVKEERVKERKRSKPCECKYKQHVPCDMSLFATYSCRVPFDNEQQWSSYLMIIYQQRIGQAFIFIPFLLSKKHIFALFQPCSVNNWLPSRFQDCPRFVPMFLCPTLVSWRPVGISLLKTRIPPVLCAVFVLFVLPTGRDTLCYRQYPDAIST